MAFIGIFDEDIIVDKKWFDPLLIPLGWYDDEFAADAVGNVTPTIALNSPADAATVSDTTPTLLFTGTDADGDTVEYEIQIDPVNTFNSGL